MQIVINPGSGPVANATAEQAAVNIKQFVADLAVRGLNVVDIGRTPEADYDLQDNDGRFAFDLTFDDGSVAAVQMPGIPVERVRWLGPDQDIWQFPRLYVDGNSWVWFFALNACHDADDPTPDVTNPGTVAGYLPKPKPTEEI